MHNPHSIDQVAAAKPGFFYGYIIAIAVFLILFMALGTRFAYGVFFNSMSAELHWNNAATALGFSISVLMEGIFCIILGGMTDKYGPRLVISIAGILVGLGYCLMPLIHSTWQFYLFYGVIIGIGMGGMFNPLVSTISRWFNVRRTLMTGLAISGNSLGLTIISPVATSLIHVYGWRTTFLAFGIVILIVVLTAAQFLKRDPSVLGLLPDGKPGRTVSGVAPEVSGLSFRQALKSYQCWLVFGILFASSFFFLSYQIYIVPDAIHNGMSDSHAAYILSVMGFGSIIGMLGLGALADRIGNRLIYIFGFILCVVASLAVVTNDIPAFYFIFAFLLGLACGSMVSSQAPLVASLFGLKNLGAIFGVCGAGATLGQAVGPYIVGMLLDFTRDYNLALSFCFILAILGVVFLLILRPLQNASFKSARL